MIRVFERARMAETKQKSMIGGLLFLAVAGIFSAAQVSGDVAVRRHYAFYGISRAEMLPYGNIELAMGK